MSKQRGIETMYINDILKKNMKIQRLLWIEYWMYKTIGSWEINGR